jgi:hypothetical protein
MVAVYLLLRWRRPRFSIVTEVGDDAAREDDRSRTREFRRSPEIWRPR